MYEIELLEEAESQLERLDHTVGRRVVKRLAWLAENLDHIRLEALTGELAGFFKLRVGDYRVIYDVAADERVVRVRFIGHRRDVYRRQ